MGFFYKKNRFFFCDIFIYKLKYYEKNYKINRIRFNTFG